MGFVRRKIPCQVSMTERQLRAIKDEAARQGISLQDVVRRIVDNYIDERIRERKLEKVDFRT